MTYTKITLVGTKGGVAILAKKGIIVNQEWKNDPFNVITDNEALAIEIELQNGDKVILATIYCPNGNPSLRLFRMINALSNEVIFLGDFNSKHKQFGCVKPNKSGQTLVNIAKDLKLFQGAVVNYDREGEAKLCCRGLKFFPANLLGSETIDKHLVGVSN